MALPLKSGADLYNQQALRLRLHNLGADPLEVGEGLIYYNTSTGLNTSGKARIYTGAGWKTLAFSEDLDVASNAEFIALKEKVDSIDEMLNLESSQTVIDTWEEVKAFLNSVPEGLELMDYLTTELGKKLDKTGGTISGLLAIDSSPSVIKFVHKDTVYGYIGVNSIGPIFYDASNNSYNILHSSNVRNYALPLTGGTITSKEATPLALKSTSSSGHTIIQFWSEENYLGALGFKGRDDPYFRTANGGLNALIHSGNVGDYNAGSANALTLEAIGDLNSVTDNRAFYSYFQALNRPSSNYATGISLKHLDLGYQYQLAFGANGDLFTRCYTSSWQPWKTIAFTDSDITGNAATATKLETARTIWGQSFDGTGDIVNPATMSTLRFRNTDGTSTSYIGRASTSNNDIFLYIPTANNFHISTNGAGRMLIDSSGNVGIGTTNPAYKLDVNGTANFSDAVTMSTGLAGARILNASNYSQYLDIALADVKCTFNAYNTDGWTDYYFKSCGNEILILNGRTLQATFAGGVYATTGTFSGNITATGEISCGGAGEEGVGGGGASVFQHVFTPSASASVTILHNLGTEDIVITLYEKDATSGLWSVCLTDIEIVSANEVTITFGSTSNQEHKVVIMGGVI